MLAYIISEIKQHPYATGMISSVSTTGFSVVGILSSEQFVKVIGAVGGVLGIVLTCMSIYYMYLKIKKAQNDSSRIKEENY